MNLRLPFFAVLATILSAPESFAHKGHHHDPGAPSSGAVQRQDGQRSEISLNAIKESYFKTVQPIFVNKCMDCHSTQTKYPWYYKLPGIRQFIDRDIIKGREHLDMTQGFPFKSHASPEEDLVAIRNSIQDGSMPPFAYRIFHPGTTLSDVEKQEVYDWIEQAKVILKK